MKSCFTLSFSKALFFFLFFIFISKVRAQEIPVTFKIVNQKKDPVAFATVKVAERNDSLKAEKKVTDSTGTIIFNLQKGGQYSVSVTSVNYQSSEKGIRVTTNQNSFTLSLEPVGKTLSGVVVTSSRPLMRQEDDKTIVYPENLIAGSTNGYDGIEKTH